MQELENETSVSAKEECVFELDYIAFESGVFNKSMFKYFNFYFGLC